MIFIDRDNKDSFDYHILDIPYSLYPDYDFTGLGIPPIFSDKK